MTGPSRRAVENWRGSYAASSVASPPPRYARPTLDLLTSNRPMTTRELASFLSVTPETVRRWTRARKVRAFRIGRQWRYYAHDLTVASVENLGRGMPGILRPK